MAASKKHFADEIRRDYCRHIIKTYRTLQLYGVRADTPVEVDLEQLYVSLTMMEQGGEARQNLREMTFVKSMLEGTAQRILASISNPTLTSLAERLLRHSQEWRQENRETLEETLKILQQIRIRLSQVEKQKGRKERETIQRQLQQIEDVLRAGDERFGQSLSAQPAQRTKTIGEAMQASERLVVLGAPGCGKTTLLKYLTLTFASDKANEQLSLKESRIPIFLRFWDYAKHADGSHLVGDAASILNWIKSQARLTGFSFPDAFLETMLKEGECILLFDGLDEVSNVKERGRAVSAVEAFVNAYPKNRFVVSSRIQGYRGIPHFASGFVEAYVNEFSDEDVQAFVTNWYLAVKGTLRSPLDRQRADEMSQDLLRAVTANPKVRQLAKNPLLLSTIALVHYNRVQLPEQRAELYDECTGFLLGFWDSSKGIHADEKIKQLLGEDFDRNAKRELLEPIAFWFHEQRSESFMADRKILQAKLAEELVQITGEKSTDKLNLVAGFLLDSARERSGLLIERENGSFAFSHLTFQEYLTARYLAYRTDCTDFVLSHLHESWWREVILLIAGHLGGENNRWAREQTTQLIDSIRNAGSEYENYLKRDLFLAAKCLIDVGPMGVHGWLRNEIADELLNIYQNAKYSLLRAEAFEHLAKMRSEQHNAELRRMHLGPLRNERQANDELIELSKSDAIVIEDLLGLLNERHYEVRVVAIRALGQIGKSDAHVIDALVEQLEDKSYNVRAEAARVLGQLSKSDVHVINGLLRLLRVHDANRYRVAADVRAAASLALGQIGEANARIIKALRSLLEEKYPHVRFNAAMALGKLGKADDLVIDVLIRPYQGQDYGERSGVTEVLIELGQRDARVAEDLFCLLKDESTFIRKTAADVLIQLQKVDVSVINALLQLLQHQYFQRDVIATLGQIGQTDQRVVGVLLRLLRHSKHYIRSYAVDVLGQIGQADERVVDALLRLVEGEETYLRGRVASALSQIGQSNNRVVDASLRLLQHQDISTHSYAADILGQIGQSEKRVVDALLRLLEYENPYSRSAAAHALIRLQKADARVIDISLSLLQYQDFNVSHNAAVALSELDNAEESIVHALLKFIEHERYYFREIDEGIKRYLVRAARAGDKGILKILVDATESKFTRLRTICASVLGSSGHAEVAGVLVRMLEEPRNMKPTMREAIFEALWELMSGSANGAGEGS